MSDLREKLAQLIADTKAHIRADGRTAYVPIGDAYDAADSVIALLQTEQPLCVTEEQVERAQRVLMERGVEGCYSPIVREALEAARQPQQANSRIEVTPLMVDRFLGAKLPKSVCSDLCVTQHGESDRSGTNLLTGIEAKYMLEVALGLRCGGCGHVPLVFGADCDEEPPCPCKCSAHMTREY